RLMLMATTEPSSHSVHCSYAASPLLRSRRRRAAAGRTGAGSASPGSQFCLDREIDQLHRLAPCSARVLCIHLAVDDLNRLPEQCSVSKVAHEVRQPDERRAETFYRHGPAVLRHVGEPHHVGKALTDMVQE